MWVERANQPSSLCFSAFVLGLTGVNRPLPEVAFSGEQELLVAPEDRLELIPLTGEIVLHFELSRASTPGTDTSMVRFPSSVQALSGD